MADSDDVTSYVGDSVPDGLRWMDFHSLARKWTVGERRRGYPRDLNILVCQRFFQCLDCAGLFATSVNGAHIQRRCGECLKSFSKAQKSAVSAVNAAVRSGRLKKASAYRCVDCGKKGAVWEHRRYDAKLDVVPTCRCCNVKRGPAHFVPESRR